MASLLGVHLLPSTGEFTYDTELFSLIASWTGTPRTATPPPPDLPFIETVWTPASFQTANDYNGGTSADYTVAIEQLVAAHPECKTVSLVCAWFGNSVDVSSCQIYPSSIHPDSLYIDSDGNWEFWQVSSIIGSDPIVFDPGANGDFITVSSNPVNNLEYATRSPPSTNCTMPPTLNPIVIPITKPDGIHAAYGGTPSDASVVRCILDLKSRGFRVVFYPFILMDILGSYPWRGRIGYVGDDVTSAATAAVNAFLGSAAIGDFTPDDAILSVDYSGSLTEFTYRRMILHYAWLVTLAGGVDLFAIGSELRGLEIIRGPAWTPAGTTLGGQATWDYPFVAGLAKLAADVRSIFDAKGLIKDPVGLHNLVVYSADWSDWMGYQHPGENGQWPHLDSLWADEAIDFVTLDNYMPMSDWTTSEYGLDQLNWLNPAPSGPWPPSSTTMNGLGQTGDPTIYSIPYLQSNLEGGEKFNWFYNDSTNLGPGFDPNGSGLIVSLSEGDRLAQARNPYFPNQEILANKQLRWWWNNPHYAVYANESGAWVPQGPPSEWSANSKPLLFLEYGVPSCDRGTNQPNVFYSPQSSESDTPFWSIWNEAPGGDTTRGTAVGKLPLRDDTISTMALQAFYEYWLAGFSNENVGGVPMLQTTFCCAWNWDVRPFPLFPLRKDVWGDAGNWQAGNWLGGRGPSLPPVAPSAPPSPGTYSTFPTLVTLGWSVHVKPKFSTYVADHVAGKSVRRSAYAAAYHDVELTYDLLRSDAAHAETQAIAGFFAEVAGQDVPFWMAPPGLAAVTGQPLGTGDGETTTFALSRSWGSYSEPVYGTSGVSAVYLDGTLLSGADWSVLPGYGASVTFVTAPDAGVAVTADFGVLWLCRFAEDVLDFEEFMAMLFELQVVKLQTAKP